MFRTGFLIALLLVLSGCDDETYSTEESSETSADMSSILAEVDRIVHEDDASVQVTPEAEVYIKYKAILSCRMSGGSEPLYFCTGMFPELKISSGNETKVYGKDFDGFVQKQNPEFEINGKEYSVYIQNGDCRTCVLRLEIRDQSGNLIKSDEAAQYGLVMVSS